METKIKNQFVTDERLREIFFTKIRYKKTRGIDGISCNKFESELANNINKIEKDLTDNTYEFRPYIEKLKLRGRDKLPRIISISTIRDKIVLTMIHDYLKEIYKDSFNKDLVNTRIKKLSSFVQDNDLTDYYFLRTDVSGFYPTISQMILFKNISSRCNVEIVELIMKAIRNPTLPKGCLRSEKVEYYSYTGVPQGLPISNILSEIYIGEIDSLFSQKYKFYSRYVDDIIVIDSKKNIESAYSNIKHELKKIGLGVNSEKTNINRLDYGFMYLGYSIKGDIVSVSQKTYQKMVNSLAMIFKKFEAKMDNFEPYPRWFTEDKLVNRFCFDLNEKITGSISDNKKYGWLFYYSSINDISTLFKLDNFIQELIIRNKYKELLQQKKLNDL
jgi:RNA-directed DNA polymerase